MLSSTTKILGDTVKGNMQSEHYTFLFVMLWVLLEIPLLYSVFLFYLSTRSLLKLCI